MTADLTQLGERIKEARLATGLSLRETATAAGISANQVAAIEKAENPRTGKPSTPTRETLLGLSRAVRLPLSELFVLAGYDADTIGDLVQEDGEPHGALSPGAVDHSFRTIQVAIKSLNKRSGFVHDRALERLEDFAVEFQAMGHGTLHCNAEEEPRYTQLALDVCRHNLRAVSYREETWWSGRGGARYLDTQDDMRGRGVEIHRIFLVEEDELDRLRQTDVFDRHTGPNISFDVLLLSDLAGQYWGDFVVYDRRLLRTATVTPTSHSSERRTAEFTDEPARVASALADFNSLLRVAETSKVDLDALTTNND
jgi:transcriptional regulator with XRE-family HTH domain